MSKRNTIQKQLVIDTIKTLSNHPTADQIYRSILEFYPGISKATVYRNLNNLTREGLLYRIHIPGGADKYDAVLDGHYHAICNQCGKFFDVDRSLHFPVDFDRNILKHHHLDDYIILFRGLCIHCRTRDEE
jgi:Fe2+ or Zn2+ uptake regulation protein